MKAGSLAGYHHWDSYPHGLGVALVELYRGHFNRDLDRMLQVLLDEHKSWSTIVHKDFKLKPGYTNVAARPAGMSFEEFQNNPLNRRPQCHCHGARREEGFIADEQSDCCAEWAYVFEVVPAHGDQPEQKLLHVLYPEKNQSGEHSWKEAGRIDLDSADEIPWTVIECGENFERCHHVAEYHGIKSPLTMQTYLGNRPLEMRDAIAVEVNGKLLKLSGSGGDSDFLNSNWRFHPERKPFPSGTWVATCIHKNGRRVELPIARRLDQSRIRTAARRHLDFPSNQNTPSFKGGGLMEHGGYNVFTRTWWRNNPAYPNGLEPSPGRRRYMACGVSYERARQLCDEYNSTHEPGRLSCNAEFETASSASDLQRQAEAMIAWGTMPSLETVLKAIAEVRAAYVPLINHAPVAQTQLSFVTDDHNRELGILGLNDHDRNFLNELGIEAPEDARWPLDGYSADTEAAL